MELLTQIFSQKSLLFDLALMAILLLCAKSRKYDRKGRSPGGPFAVLSTKAHRN